jgi:glutamate dehydrogenase
VYDALLASDLPEDPYLAQALERYFPARLCELYPDAMKRHRLRRELIATYTTNSMVNRAGITFAFRVAEETAATVPDVARAYTVARDAFDMRSLGAAIDALDSSTPAEVQLDLLLEGRKLVERAARWLLRNRRSPIQISEAVEYFGPGIAALSEHLPELVVGSEREALERRSQAFQAAGVPAELATRVAGLDALLSALDLVDISNATGCPGADVASAYFKVGAELDLHWLRERIAALPRGDRWQTLARAALREDLYTQHRHIATEVVEAGPPDASIDDRLAVWLAEDAATVERCRQSMAAIKHGGVHDLTTLSVALREVRTLAQAGVAPAPSADAS